MPVRRPSDFRRRSGSHAPRVRAAWDSCVNLRHRVGPLLLLLMVLGLSACGPRIPLPTRPAWEALPAGSPLRSQTLSEADAWLRHYLMFGEHTEMAAAFADRSPLAPGDGLLRGLQAGIALQEMGEYERSNELLAVAEVEADLRYTRSLRRELASILVNDRVLAYTPTAGELAMIPYYRMLNYLALGDRDAAVVESRKANALLTRLDRAAADRCHSDASILYLAGLIQRSAGELNDALVSLRQAERSLSGCEGSGAAGGAAGRMIAQDLYDVARATGVVEVADSIATRYSLTDASPPDANGGELLLVVEHGFVAHRTEQSIHIPIPNADLKQLDGMNDRGLSRFATRLSTELLLGQDEGRAWRRRHSYRSSGWLDALDGAYILRLTWPVFRLEANRPQTLRAGVGERAAEPVEIANLSVVMRDELARERPAVLSRLVLRGLTKYLVSREVEEATEEKHGEAAGFLVGRLVNLVGNQLEQADTRSWTLLPDRISVVRMHVPEGMHPVRLEVVGAGGERRTKNLGDARIDRGQLTVLRTRVWSRDREESWDNGFDRLWEADEQPLTEPGLMAADTAGS